MIRLTEWHTEPGFEFRRAWIADDDGQPAPVADLGGTHCWIETKETLLEAGVAVCLPVDEALAEDWPHAVRVTVDGDGRLLPGATADVRVVAAARAFAALQAAGRAEIGKEL